MDNLTPEEFKCYYCGKVGIKGLTDEEALEDVKQKFGEDIDEEDCVRLCDKCYNKLFPLF